MRHYSGWRIPSLRRNSIRLRSNRGSVPGPAKRLIRFRDAVRAGNKTVHDYDIVHQYVIQQGMKLKVAVKDIVNEIDGSIFSVTVSDGAKVTLQNLSPLRLDLI